MCYGLQCLWVYRGSSAEIREKIVGQIKQRQEDIEVDCQEWNPICIFAEGTTSNGTSLTKFKRGAFSAMRSVKPVYVKFND